ncbi:hypothetical protein HQ590_04450, partial [bacterium]|nr:hypothetical protein [bacterium]
YSLPSRPWDPRHAASVFVHDNALWIAAGNNMAPDVWKLQRHPPSAPPALAAPEPAGTGMLLNVAVGLFDIEDRTGHIFDEKNPERQVYPVKLSKSGTTIVPIFGNIFGLNAYGLKGENIYAQMHIDRGGGKLYFDKWIDGGAGLELIVDNAANPPEILIRRTGR